VVTSCCDRACGDQLLRNFLKGLTLRVRGD